MLITRHNILVMNNRYRNLETFVTIRMHENRKCNVFINYTLTCLCHHGYTCPRLQFKCAHNFRPHFHSAFHFSSRNPPDPGYFSPHFLLNCSNYIHINGHISKEREHKKFKSVDKRLNLSAGRRASIFCESRVMPRNSIT